MQSWVVLCAEHQFCCGNEGEKMSIGTRLRSAREARGWTQFQLGVVIGKRDTDVSRWERESLMPRADIIIMWSQALGVSADYLLGLKKEMDLDPSWTDRSQVRPDIALGQLPEAPAEAPAPRKTNRQRS